MIPAELLERIRELARFPNHLEQLIDLLQQAIVEQHNAHEDTDVGPILDLLGGTRSPVVRQILAFLIARHSPWPQNISSGLPLAMKMWRLQDVDDTSGTTGMLLAAVTRAVYAGAPLSAKEAEIVGGKILEAFNHPILILECIEILWSLYSTGRLSVLTPEHRGSSASALERHLPDLRTPSTPKRRKRNQLTAYEREAVERTEILIKELRQSQ